MAPGGHPRLCIALDSPDPATALRAAAATEGAADLFKVGLSLFIGGGPDVVARLAARRPVFLDLKLHDIPAQVERAVEAAVDLGAAYLTVHAGGGREMVAAAAGAAGGALEIVAVTVLTSLDQAALRAVGCARSLQDQVLGLAELALASGVRGLVCSPRELDAVRERFGASDRGGPLVVVPGIRRRDDERHDQKRTLSAREAAARGADVVVVGRPVTGAADPAEAARGLKAELGG